MELFHFFHWLTTQNVCSIFNALFTRKAWNGLSDCMLLTFENLKFSFTNELNTIYTNIIIIISFILWYLIESYFSFLLVKKSDFNIKMQWNFMNCYLLNIEDNIAFRNEFNWKSLVLCVDNCNTITTYITVLHYSLLYIFLLIIMNRNHSKGKKKKKWKISI